jgi:Flp pilus assembly protein TadG
VSDKSHAAATSRDTERGATLVEVSITLPLVLVLLIGIVEFSFLFKDWLTVGHSAREGARVAATLADDRFSNIAVLDQVAGTLGTVGINDTGVQVRIYDAIAGTSDTYTYAPGTTYCYAAGDCCEWTPCPDPRYTIAQGYTSNHYTVPTWAPSSRDISAPLTDRVGVEVQYSHNWITNLIQTNTWDLTIAVDYQIEPQVFE